MAAPDTERPSNPRPVALHRWHQVVAARDTALLADLLAEDAVFHSPVVHRPQEGRDLVMLYLTGAMHVLANESFRYVREISSDHDAMLEFTTQVDGTIINGIDLFTWDDDGRITDFTVMIRPLRAINLVHAKMGELLALANATDPIT